MKRYSHTSLVLFAFFATTYHIWTFQQTAHAESFVDAGAHETLIEKSSPLLPTCTTDNFPCPCQEGRCPTGFFCDQQQQCFPRACTGECAVGQKCLGGYCIDKRPCWGILCAADEMCVDDDGRANCKKKCGDSVCHPSYQCVSKRCILKENLCNIEGESRTCQGSTGLHMSQQPGTQRCVRGQWSSCYVSTHVDCFCSAVVYCEGNQIYESPRMAYNAGSDNTCSLCKTTPGTRVHTCQKPCDESIQGKRFPADQHQSASLCTLSVTENGEHLPGPCCVCDATSRPAHAFPLVFLLFFLLFHRRFRKHPTHPIFR